MYFEIYLRISFKLSVLNIFLDPLNFKIGKIFIENMICSEKKGGAGRKNSPKHICWTFLTCQPTETKLTCLSGSLS